MIYDWYNMFDRKDKSTQKNGIDFFLTPEYQRKHYAEYAVNYQKGSLFPLPCEVQRLKLLLRR